MRKNSRRDASSVDGCISRPNGVREEARDLLLEQADLAVRAEAHLLGQPGVKHHQRISSVSHQLGLRTAVRKASGAVKRRRRRVQLQVVDGGHCIERVRVREVPTREETAASKDEAAWWH